MANSKLDFEQVLPIVLDEAQKALQVAIVSGAGTVTVDFSQTDDAPFTPAVDKVAMMGAFADEVGPDSVDEGDAGAVRMSTNRILYTELRDGASGAERGVSVSAANALKVDGSAVTQPMSAASLPLPSGAATSANQTNKAQYTHLTDGTDDVLVTAVGELNVLATAQPGVDVGDVTINNASGGASVNIQDGGNSITVDGTVAATQSGTWSVNNTDTGFANSEFVRNDYSSVNVTTATYVTLVASTAQAYKEFEIFDSSGQTMVIAFGAAASEVNQFLIFPGGNGRIKKSVPTSTRVSIKAVSATASVGELDLNLYG